MKLLIVSNRNINNESATDLSLFGEKVNRQGASEIRLAWAEKGAGGKWKLELIKEPRNLTGDNIPSRSAFLEYLNLLKENQKNCVYYVHGFNKEFSESLQQAYSIHKRYGTGVVLFSWPSNPGGFITKEYKKAKAIASNSIVALDRTFEKLHSYMFEFADENCEISLNLLVHSLGNYIFEQFIKSPIFSGETKIFDNIVLNAADIDVKRHRRWADNLKFSRKVYATINERDKILDASDIINPDRLGNTAKHLNSSRIDYFDLTDGKKVKKKHQHFETTADVNKTVENFFKKVLHGEVGFPLPGAEYDERINAYVLDSGSKD
jgi:esterase/lipase superfamily enzyme